MNKKALLKNTLLVLTVFFVVSIILYGTYVLATLTAQPGEAPANGTYTNNSAPTFYFNASSTFNATFNCSLYINNSLNATNELVDNATLSSLTASSIFADNTYSWYVNCTDTDGTINVTGVNTITIDTTPPALSVTFSSGTDWYFLNITATDDNLDTIIVDVYNYSTLLWTNTSAFNSSPYEINYTSLGDGVYKFNISANDTVGNSNSTLSPSGDMYFVVDSVPPSVSFNESATDFNGTILDRNYILVGINATDDQHICSLEIKLFNSTGGLINSTMQGYNATDKMITASLSANFTNLLDGNYSFKGEVSDCVWENIQETETWNVTIDTTPPTITILSPENTTYNTSTIWFNATADETVDTWIVNYNGTNYTGINFSSTLEDGNYHLFVWANDSVGNLGLNDSIWFTVSTDNVAPAVSIEDNFKVNEINGENMTVVGGTDEVEIWGMVNDSALKNWSINVYNGSNFVNEVCSNVSGENVNGSLCTWNTNASCPDSECWNYSLQLIAYDLANNHNETWRYNILIDNVYPYINNISVLTLTTSNDGGFYSMKEWNARVNISDTYLREVRAYILDNNNNTVIEWGQQCNEADGENCNQSISGMFNKTWYTDQYSINGENVSAHNVFYFPEVTNLINYVSIPGCFAENGSVENYSCYDDCINIESECQEWRWHLVYNVSNFTENASQTGRLLGLVRDDWCDGSGCTINSSLIQHGISKFIPQQDSYDFSNGQWSETNLTNITLYNIGDLTNINLTQDMPSGNYQFAFSANDNWWGTMSSWDIYVDNVLPVVNEAIINNPDNFFSPYDNIMNLSVNVTDNQNITLVQADLWQISNNTCTEGVNCSVNLTFNPATGLWDGSINVSDYISSGQAPQGTVITFRAYDDSINRNEDTNQSMADIVLHDIGAPVMNGTQYPETCMRFGSDTVNFSKVLDFGNINFVMDVEMNLSCMSNGTVNLPEYQDANLINITSVNMSTQQQAQNLMQLPQAIQIRITQPHQFGASRIYINSSFFIELNTTATIKFYNLPFASQPAIVNDIGAAGVNGTVIWDQNGFNEAMNVMTGNLTFTVLGFSGYNITDNSTPIITFITPTDNEIFNTENININFSVNGTGTEVSWVQVYVNGTGYAYNPNESLYGVNCTPETPGSDLYYCNLSVNLGDGIHTLNVTAYDYGGETGNNAADEINFTVDTQPPNLTVNLPSTNSYQNTTAIVINYTVTDTTFNKTTINVYNSTNTIVNTTTSTAQGNVQITTQVLNDDVYRVEIIAFDSVGYNTTSIIYNVTIDTIKPAVVINNAVIAGYYNSTQILNATITDANTFTSFMNVNDSIATNSSGTTANLVYILSTDGNYSYYVTATDIANNTNTTATVSGIIIDTTDPIITSITAHDYYVNTTTIEIAGTYTETNLKNVTIVTDAGSYLADAAAGAYNATVTLTANINNTITVIATDLAGNSDTETDWVIQDNTAPELLTQSETDTDTTATITYTANESVNVTINYGTNSAALASTPVYQTNYSNGTTISLSSLSASTLYYYNITICDQAANCVTNGTYSLTTAAAEEDDDSSSSSGGGSGIIAVPINPTVTTTYTILPAGTTNITINNQYIPLLSLGVTTTESVNNVKFIFTKLDTNTIKMNGTVYKYLEIGHVNLDNSKITGAKIKFKIEKSWLTTNKITKEQIALFRYVTNWDELATKPVSEDNTYFYFEADSPGLSMFAIGLTGTTPEPTTAITPENTPTEQPPAETTQTETIPEPQPTADKNYTWLWGAILLVVLIIMLFFVFRKKEK